MGRKSKAWWTDFTAGPVANTGRRLDVAIDGDGFFAVQGADETAVHAQTACFRYVPTVSSSATMECQSSVLTAH